MLSRVLGLRGLWAFRLRCEGFDGLYSRGTQSLQNPLIKECTLNLIRVPIIT